MQYLDALGVGFEAGLGRAGSFCHGMWVVGLACVVDGVFVVAGICMRGLERGERHAFMFWCCGW